MHDLRIDQPYVVERWPKAPHVSLSSPRARAVAECGLVLVSLAAAFSFTRVFASRAFVLPVVATALVTHLCVAVMRRRHWRAALALPVGVLVVALTSAAGSLRSTIRADLSDAWVVVNNSRTPVPPTRALVLAASLLIGLAVVIADSLAFRRRALFAALLPAVFVFGLSAMYGDHHRRLLSIAFLVAAAVTFALAHRLAFFDRGGDWMIDRALAQRRYVMSGLAVSSCAVLIALAVGPSLPGAGNEPLVAWRDIGNGWAQQDDGVTLAPLVSVRAQLVQQSDREVFTVESAQPDYWRLTALDVFDGVEWSASTSTTAITLPTSPTTDALRQVVTINALRGNWLPAASTAIALSFDDGTAILDPTTSTLESADRLGKGDSYTVWSSTGADTTAPSASALSVPRAVRQQLSVLANQIVRAAGAVTPTDKARALEAYFLDNFTYDINVAAGSSITDITSFLQRRSGYCEQFAATFAAMARVLGIPSRVAIGYRVGTDTDRDGEFTVTGRDAHAWPEVYLAGQGWVRFEPTPGTAGATTASDTPASAAAATPAAAASEAVAPTTTVPETAAADDPSSDTAADSAPAPSRGTVDRGLVALVAALALAITALPVAIDAIRRRRSRRRAERDPRELIVWLWRDALRWFRIAGADVRATETPLEVARRAVASIAPAGPPLTQLAQRVTEACYSEAGPTSADLDAAAGEVAAIRHCAKEQLGRSWRLRWYVAQVRGVVVHAGSTSSSVAQASSIS
jgi:transglutaminase-like putative cysteine protease